MLSTLDQFLKSKLFSLGINKSLLDHVNTELTCRLMGVGVLIEALLAGDYCCDAIGFH